MTNKNITANERRFVYGRIFRLFHWLVAMLVIATLILIFSRNLVEDAGLDKLMVSYHRSLGVVILTIVMLRLAWRLFSRDLPYTGVSPLIQFMASLSHATIYLSLLSITFLGWMESSARNKPVFIFDMQLPMLIAKNFELAEELQSWHINIALIFCGIIVIHILSALWHYFVRQDGVLYAMIPFPYLRRPWNKNIPGAPEINKENF